MSQWQGYDASGEHCDFNFQYIIVCVLYLLTPWHLDLQYGCGSVGVPSGGWL